MQTGMVIISGIVDKDKNIIVFLFNQKFKVCIKSYLKIITAIYQIGRPMTECSICN